jgi:hypothetical protein
MMPIQVYQATLPIFSKFGKLLTGLQRSELKASVTMNTENHGLFPLQTRDEEVTDPVNSDSVWKASLILNELQRFDEKGPLVSNLAAFGEIPKVPWLDILEKEQAEAILKTASTRKDVSAVGRIFFQVCSFLLSDRLVSAGDDRRQQHADRRVTDFRYSNSS